MASCFISTIFFELQILTLPFSTYIPDSLRYVFTLLFASVSAFFSCACYPILVSMTIEHLRKHSGREGIKLFGNERTGGSLGTGLNVLLLGFLFELKGSVSIFITLLSWSACALSSVFLFLGENDDNDNDPEIYALVDQDHDHDHERWEMDPVDSSWKTIINVVQCLFTGTFWTSLSFIALTTACFGGITMAEQFTVVHLIDKYHTRSTICGLISALGVIGEVICFSYSGRLSDRYGLSTVLITSSLWLVFRLCVYAVAENLWIYAGLGLVQGTTFALFHAAAVMLIAERMPTHLQASGQFVLYGAQGFGRCATMIVGEWITEKYSSQTMFLSTAFLLLTSTLVYFLAGKLENQNNSKDLQFRRSVSPEEVTKGEELQ